MTITQIARSLRRQFSRKVGQDSHLTSAQEKAFRHQQRNLTDSEVISDFLEFSFCDCCRKPLFLATALARQATSIKDWIELLQVGAEKN